MENKLKIVIVLCILNILVGITILNYDNLKSIVLNTPLEKMMAIIFILFWIIALPSLIIKYKD